MSGDIIIMGIWDAEMTHKQSVIEILDYALNGQALAADIFSQNFRQYLNGNTLDLSEFHESIGRLRKKYVNVNLKILSMVSRENNVHSHHLVSVTENSGDVKKHEVFSRYEFSNNKVINCYEFLREISDLEALGHL